MASQSNSGQRKMARRIAPSVHSNHGTTTNPKPKRMERRDFERITGRKLKANNPPRSVGRALKKRLKNREDRAWKNDLG